MKGRRSEIVWRPIRLPAGSTPNSHFETDATHGHKRLARWRVVCLRAEALTVAKTAGGAWTDENRGAIVTSPDAVERPPAKVLVLWFRCPVA